MRISALPSGKAYRRYLQLRSKGRIDVFLDGVLQKSVHMADDKRGVVVITALNANGDSYVIGNKLATRTLRGKVVIRVRKEVFCAVR